MTVDFARLRGAGSRPCSDAVRIAVVTTRIRLLR
ncbi:MAG: hypothetical protein QOF28_1357 [Actinomycetota bacterium]|nr:hypothetical protein [Actinomycetota bacterium]